MPRLVPGIHVFKIRVKSKTWMAGTSPAMTTVTAKPVLHSTLSGERLELAAAGAWTVEHAHELEPLVAAASRRRPKAARVAIDLGKVERLDTFGAWLLERLARATQSAGLETSIVGLSERYRGLLAEVQRVNRAPPPPAPSYGRFGHVFENVGRAVAGSARDIVLILQMLGEATAASFRILVRPAAFRLTSVVHHLDRVGLQAVPIILLITFLLGCIIAQQGIFHFRRFGAELYVVDMIGILVLREIGVIMVAIMIAGRSGSAYTAELGSMKMREEIDALRTMGFSPVDVLVLPRLIALVIALPILAFLGSMAALYGGGLVCWLYGGISPEIFVSRLRDAISLDHFAVGMIKAPFMALMIGIVACAEGLQVKGSTDSLGLHTTASVVKSVFLVIVLDGVFAMFFAAIGK
jgi:phospholipid/cholesterol/gamma-HCH transport system permease protein